MILDDDVQAEFARAMNPAFGRYPKAFRGAYGDPVDAANLPVDVLRGRTAGLLGLPADLLNLFQSPMPMEVFGDTQYEPLFKVPYGSEHFLKTLPLAPTSRAGEVAGQAASFVPLNPMPAVRGAKAVGGMVGDEINAAVMGQRDGLLGNALAPVRPAFAVPQKNGGLSGNLDDASLLVERIKAAGKEFVPKIEAAAGGSVYVTVGKVPLTKSGEPMMNRNPSQIEYKARFADHPSYWGSSISSDPITGNTVDAAFDMFMHKAGKGAEPPHARATFSPADKYGSIEDISFQPGLSHRGNPVTKRVVDKRPFTFYQPDIKNVGKASPPLLGAEQTSLLGNRTTPKAEVSPLGFYSAVEQQALNIPRKQGSGESFLNDLAKGQDVKKYEMETMGLDEFLKGKPNVTRQEVQDYIAGNRINVQEVRLGEPFTEDPVGVSKRLAIFDRYEPEIQALYKEIDQYETNTINARNLASKNETEAIAALNREGNPQPIPTTDDWNKYYAAKAEMERVNKIPLDSREYVRKLDELVKARDVEANKAYTIPEPAPTKHQRWQLAGGENYREILLTLPRAKSEVFTEIQQKIKRLEAMKEIQAEFAAAGNIEKANSFATKANALEESIKELKHTPIPKPREDYKSSHFDEPNILAHMRVNDRVDADGKKMLLIEELQSDWHQAGREKGYASKETKRIKGIVEEQPSDYGFQTDYKVVWEDGTFSGGYGSKEIAEEVAAKGKTNAKEGVPDAPFKDTWHQLALKRALKEAVDKGYDRIGLTTGAQQAERYNLAKQVDEVIAKRNPDGSFNLDATLVGGGSQQSIGKNISSDKLADYVGKDLAKTMQSQTAGTDVYSGDALKVGGEGMKKYYDEIYPAFLNKQGKKYGAKVGETRIKTKRGVPGGEPVRYLDITPEMRKAIQEGQPIASIQNELAKALA